MTELIDNAISTVFTILANILWFPFALLWDTLVVVTTGAVLLTWLWFLFRSVVGVPLVLLFAPRWFLRPLALLHLCVALKRGRSGTVPRKITAS